jgi:hypothetical protein
MRNQRKPSSSDHHYNPGVTVTELAEGTVAYNLGYLTAAFGIPVLGLILLVVGLRQRSRRRRPPLLGNPMGPPGYPPSGPSPYGYPPPSGPVDTGYPYQPGPPAPPAHPQYYPTGYQAEPPRGSSGTALIVVGSILLAFGLVGILRSAADMASQHRSSAHGSAHSADVGQCIGQSNLRENNLTPAPQDCSKPDSIFEVASKGGASANCPDGKIEDSDYAFLRDGTTTLCLMLNFKQGQCYAATGEAKNPTFAATACDGLLPRFEVVKRIDGSSDASMCPAGTKAISYPVPARLYCLERLQN